MSVKEVLGALGSWELHLSEETPDEVWAQLGFFGHIAILRGLVEPLDLYGDQLLASARYVGVLLDREAEDTHTIGGPGMVTWLGDEDEKGEVLETKVTVGGMSLPAAVAAVLPDALTVGTIHNPGGTLPAGTAYQFVAPRTALGKICDAFNVEFRVNGDGSVDVGTQAQLYSATPDSIVVRRGAGADMDLVALGGAMGVKTSARDYSDRVLLVGQTTDDGTFAIGAQSAPSVPFADLQGNPVKRTRMISESGETTGTVSQRAQLHLNRFNRTTYGVKVTAQDYEMSGNFVVGDNTYVYDPETGLVDAGNEVHFRGEVLHPAIVRVSEISWPVSEGHTVAFRTGTGVWIDLTRFVQWESGSNELVVGDLPRSLTGGYSNPVLDRADSLPDPVAPGAPTDLQLATTSVVNPVSGQNSALILAEWVAPALNVDGTVVSDLSHFVVQYRPAFRAPQWDSRVTEGTSIELPAVIDLVYDVRVAAVDRAGNQGAYTGVVSITAAQDQTAPNAPSDPVVSSYLGQLRIVWNGLDNVGAPMPPDFNRVDVHVGTTTGFTPTAATLVSSLSTGGVAYATAPYGSTRYVRLVAYDHTQNPSAASGTVSGATAQVADGDIASLNVGKLVSGTVSADVVMAGRFATALTGARREMNAVGFQAWDASNTLTISLDGINNLLTGRLRTALTGRRIDMGAAGSLGEINMYAPDGKRSFLRAWTEGTGVEAVQFGLDDGIGSLWNRINYNSERWANYRAERHDFTYSTAFRAASGESGWFIVRESTGTADTGPSLIRLFVESGSVYINRKVSGVARTGFRVLDSGETGAYFRSTNSFRVWEDTGSVHESRLNISASDVWFEWPGTSMRMLLTPSTASAASSPQIRLFNANGFGGLLKFHYSEAFPSEKIQLRGWADDHDIQLWCSTVVESSSEATKDEIQTFGGDAVALLRPWRQATFRRKPGRRPDGEPMPRGPIELGAIAEEAPPQLQAFDDDGSVHGIRHGAWLALLTQALRQIDQRLVTLETRRPA